MNIEELQELLKKNDHGDEPTVVIEIHMPNGDKLRAFAMVVERDFMNDALVIRNGKP